MHPPAQRPPTLRTSASSGAPRLEGLDAARGLAVLVMALVNFDVVLSMEGQHPLWLRALTDAFAGRAAASFVTLAGMGIALLGERRVLLRRALFLGVVGYGWYELWPGDILHFYAFYLTLGALCLRLPARWLLGLAPLTTASFWVLFQLLDYGAGWDWETLDYVDFWEPVGQLRHLVFNGLHPLLPWLSFLFLGMGLARLGLSEPRVVRRSLLWAAVALLGTEVLSSHLSALPDEREGWVVLTEWFRAPDAIWGTAPLPPGPLYVISAAASAVLCIGACLELARVERARALLRPLIAAGQLALTLYVAHILFLYFLVMPAVAALLADAESPVELELWLTWGASLTFGVLAAASAVLWRSRFRRGPLEGLMRRLTD